ncbi:MAG: HupE/UreJ family protein [Bauldia sp.]|nr:HupE/UreJ family protein [Bauldia sp.]
MFGRFHGSAAGRFRLSFATLRRLGLTAALVLLPSVAFAHTGDHSSGLAHGFAHPITGLDHILAMVMVGIFAWQLGGRAVWLVPATFVVVMALGGVLGISGVEVPFVEIGIALSVVVLGAAVAFGAKAPLAAAMALVGFFAIFHGHAHGMEMPGDAGRLAYGIGFMLGTALLHLGGIAIGIVIGRLADRNGPAVTRAAGALVGAAGVGILTGII